MKKNNHDVFNDYKVEFDASSSADVNEGISSKTSRPYKMVRQSAWLHFGEKYPARCMIPVPDEGSLYPQGFYSVSNFLSVGGYGDLQIDRGFVLTLISK